ncbi:NAD-dependent epimerase/dehydratase family protein [Streptomyces viridochromogenes]|uniref:NAD-dependent epimerase/dehydratase family protein n=1 Tax=Streptomyces viridochromogenes TaxID=1938 RepID=UPI00069FE385|nr:NAD(P)-dependent oxidoreductase [Streptomyces viridochromogenes]KOG21705.1 NAD-dependent dehydratase [Streptomyces viridochromogenes]KOG29715.1 NAD-dependent dehydratase [Streptomyces viridochromogenes]
MTYRILITGAAGEIGTMLRTGLARPGRVLRLLDTAVLPAPAASEPVEIVQASVTDLQAMQEAVTGVDAVVHLAALLGNRRWEEYLDVNIHGTYTVLEAARRAGVTRVVLAGSHHAAGFHLRSEETAPDYLFPRPDSFYGVAKVAAEALGSVFHDRHGMDVICLRIASYRPEPDDRRCLAQWLSPGDCVRLIDAAIAAPSPGFRIVWGVSANTRGWLSLKEGEAIGYHPQDDAETYAERILTQAAPENLYEAGYLGGVFCAPGFDQESRV